MDYRQNENDSWAWHGQDTYLQKDSSIVDVLKCGWTGVTQNEEDLSYMLEETTPVKACGDLPYQLEDCEIMSKTPQECKEYSSQVKRRRLNFYQDSESSEDISCSYLKSKERFDLDEDVVPEMWDACLQEAEFEDLRQSEAWLAECLNDTDLNISSDEGNTSNSTSDVQIGSKEHSVTACDPGSSSNQRSVRTSANIIFKGTQSYMRMPSKLTSSVACPFDFIKPCGIKGDVTLKDINQRILTPPPKPRKVPEESPVYPISAISGKPVIGKTKIPTQGGKGSITIMRTKG